MVERGGIGGASSRSDVQGGNSNDSAPSAPIGLLAGAIAAVFFGALLLLGGGNTIDLLGYVLATFVAVLFVSWFRVVDGRRQSEPTYEIPRFAQIVPLKTLSWVILLAGFAIGAIHVWRFADAVARS